jgi:hypothetical protein
MTLRWAAAVITVLAASVPMTASAAAAGWDTTPLFLTAPSDDALTLGPLVETTDDGAAWVAWSDGSGTGPSQVLVRRITADGVPGAQRVLTATAPGYNGAISMAALPGGDVRVVYASALGETLEERRLTPTSTGDAVVLYDKATTDDGDVTDNGNVYGSTANALSAPGGATWVTFVRLNSGQPVVSARRIAGDDAVGSLVALTQHQYEPSATVDGSGRLIIAIASGAQARTVLVPVDTDGNVGAEVEIRPSSPPAPPFAVSNTPAIVIDAAGIATVGWRLDTASGRYLEARRVDTTTTPMTPLV